MQQVIIFILSLLISFNLLSQIKKTNIILVGDIMLGRSVMTTSLQKNDPDYPFRNVADKLNSADIVFANLENPIIKDCPPSTGGFMFCADPKMIEGLKFANIGIVNLANNHTKNYGEVGLKETELILSENGIKYVGDGNLEVIEKNGTKFGFLGFDYVDNKPTATDYNLVTTSKKQVNVLIVAVHWGDEYTAIPTEFQRNTASLLVTAGADVIAGSHPHWVQPVDYTQGKPVFYSLGNFVFDQMWSEETRHGDAVEINFSGIFILNVIKLPIYMKNFAQPQWQD